MGKVSDFTALLASTTHNGKIGKGAIISFSFPTTSPSYFNGLFPSLGLASFRAFSEAEKTAARNALEAWAEVSGLVFVEVAPGLGDIKFSTYDFSLLGMGGAGFAYNPSHGTDDQRSSDVVIKYGRGTDTRLLLHEIGHALGLKHSFEDHGDEYPGLVPEMDNYSYTVMSYTSGGYSGRELGTLDVQAIQYLYGDTSQKGGDIASWSFDAETLVLSQWGSEGLDEIFGAGGSNVIFGLGGNDRIVGRFGTNTFFGGDGDDTLLGSDSVDRLFGESGDDEIHAGNGANEVDGGLGNDRITAGSGSDLLSGGAGHDWLSGGSGNDVLRGDDGDDTLIAGTGSDETFGGEGFDVLYFGASLTSGDRADGGPGTDVLVLQGNYGAGYTFHANNLANIESISLQSGANSRWGDTSNRSYDYRLTTVDANVAAHHRMIVNGQSLRLGEDLTFNGSAETDGHFLAFGGHGLDSFVGGAGDDIFFFEGTRWGASDKIDGGDGRDVMVLSAGSGMNSFVFGPAQLSNIEAISVNNRFATDPSQFPSYELVLRSEHVSAQAGLIVNGSSLDAGQVLKVNGSGVIGGSLHLFGGSGGDALQGGTAADVLYGGGGADILYGGDGPDAFRYDDISHSSVAAPDSIGDFSPGDRIDLSRIDGDVFALGDQEFAFIGSSIFSSNGQASAGELRAEHLSGREWLVQGDIDGDGTADFAILVNLSDGDILTGSDFNL